MKNATHVLGQSAPSPRVTKAAVLLLAAALSVPVFLLLTVVEIVLL
ncbi:hypothetical protein ACUXV3_03010 [Roseobacteraceae bacterium NS-SX3]